MKRSTYSLILMDRVVEAVDALAAQQGTSRSNLINQILAEHVCCVTPEQQMQQFFSNLTRQMDAALRIQQQGSDAMLSILGAVQYKYRPTIRYSVELFRELQQEHVGQLRITCRTQSQAFLDAIQEFFRFWIRLEQTYRPYGACTKGLYELAPARLTVALLRQGIADETALGEAVGQTIRMFHRLLQTYFSGLQQNLPTSTLGQLLERQYRETVQINGNVS